MLRAREGSSELGSKVPHQLNVRACKTVDRLPIVPNRKNTRISVLCLQRTEKTRSSCRNVLKLINQEMTIRALIATGFNMLCRTDDHVLEVDPFAQTSLIRVLGRRPRALEVPKERSERLRKRVNLAHFGQGVEDLFRRNWLGRDIGRELVPQDFGESAFDSLIAVGFDKGRAIFVVDLALPGHPEWAAGDRAAGEQGA